MEYSAAHLSSTDTPYSSGSSSSGRERRRMGKQKQQRKLDAARAQIHELQDANAALQQQLAVMHRIVAELSGHKNSDAPPGGEAVASPAPGDSEVVASTATVFDLFEGDVCDAATQTDICVDHRHLDVFVSAQQLAVVAWPNSLTPSGAEHASVHVNATSAAVVTSVLPHSLTTTSGVEHASVDVNATSASVVAPRLPHSLTSGGVEHASDDVNATSAYVVAPKLPLSLTSSGVEHTSSHDVNANSAVVVVPGMSTAGCADAAAGNRSGHTSTAVQQSGVTACKPLASTGGEAVASPAPGHRTSHPWPLVQLDGGGTSVTTLEPTAGTVGIAADYLGGQLPQHASSELSMTSLAVGCGNDSISCNGKGQNASVRTGPATPDVGRCSDFNSQHLANTVELFVDTRCGPSPAGDAAARQNTTMIGKAVEDFDSQHPANTVALAVDTQCEPLPPAMDLQSPTDIVTHQGQLAFGETIADYDSQHLANTVGPSYITTSGSLPSAVTTTRPMGRPIVGVSGTAPDTAINPAGADGTTLLPAGRTVLGVSGHAPDTTINPAVAVDNGITEANPDNYPGGEAVASPAPGISNDNYPGGEAVASPAPGISKDASAVHDGQCAPPTLARWYSGPYECAQYVLKFQKCLDHLLVESSVSDEAADTLADIVSTCRAELEQARSHLKDFNSSSSSGGSKSLE